MQTCSSLHKFLRIAVLLTVFLLPAQNGHAAPKPDSDPSSALTWVYVGGPRGGIGYDVRMDARLPGMVYVTDSHAGMFLSKDNGQNFFPINDGITARIGSSGDIIPVFSLTIDPHDPKILWAGMQYTGGIFKSSDGGQTWVEMNKGVATDRGLSFRGFTVDPRTSEVVYALAEIASWGWTPDHAGRPGRGFDMTKGIIYKSSDGGKYWNAIWEGDHLARYLWIDPRDPDVLYASTGFFDREAANSDPATDPGGVGALKSTDGGKTWEILNEDNGLTGLFLTSLFMKPDEPDVLLAAAGILSWADQKQKAGQGGVYLTEDGGETWRKVIDPYDQPGLPPDYMIMTTVEYCMSDPDVAYADGLGGFYRSEDGGRTWEILPADFPPGIVKRISVDIMCDPNNPDRLFINFYGGGNALTEDGGRTFVDASHGYSGAQVRGVAIDPQQPGHVYTVTNDGVWGSYDGGDHWIGLANGPGAVGWFSKLVIDPSDASHLLAASTPDGILIETRDGGQTWTEVARTRKQSPEGSLTSFSDVAFAPSNPQRVYAGTVFQASTGVMEVQKPAAGLFISDDGGRTWQTFSGENEVPDPIVTLAVHPQDHNFLLASSGQGVIFKSRDGGKHWERCNQNPLPIEVRGDAAQLQQLVTSLTFDPRQPERILAGANVAALFESRDGGESWERADTGLPPEGIITSIVTAGNSAWFLATQGNGVFMHSEGEAVWSQINNGLTMREIIQLAITSDGQHVYAASNGMGIFRLDLNGQPPEAAPQPPPRDPTPASPQLTESPAQPTTKPPSTPQPSQGLPCGSAMALPLAILGFVGWHSLGQGRRR